MIRMQAVSPFLSRGYVAHTASRASEVSHSTNTADTKLDQTTKAAAHALLRQGG